MDLAKKHPWLWRPIFELTFENCVDWQMVLAELRKLVKASQSAA
jgi:hypothetical protein